jgi:hypothetical protein
MPKCLRWLLTVVVLAAPLATPLTGQAQNWMDDSQMFIIQGTVVDSERTAGELGYDSFSLSFQGKPDAKTRWLAVVGANTWNGDSFDAKNVLDDIVPPNLVIAGKQDVVDKIMTAPNNTKFRLEGMLLQGDGVFMVQSANVIPAK